MGKKSFGLGQRIIATLTSKIDGDIADNRPVGGGMIFLKGSIFKKSSLTQCKRFQFPNVDEYHPQMSSRLWLKS